MQNKYNNPDQFQLFEKMVNREILPIDGGIPAKKEPLSPGVASAIASVKRHLEDFNADLLKKPDLLPPSSGH